MEPLKLALFCLDENSVHELCQDNKVQDDGCSEQRVLTRIVENNSVVPAHEDLGGVFIHGSLAVSNIRNILDHDLTGRGGKRRVKGVGWGECA